MVAFGFKLVIILVSPPQTHPLAHFEQARDIIAIFGERIGREAERLGFIPTDEVSQRLGIMLTKLDDGLTDLFIVNFILVQSELFAQRASFFHVGVGLVLLLLLGLDLGLDLGVKL